MSSTQPIHSDLSALDRALVWLNSEPLTAEELRGRVVLVDIWTYSCVNWLRTLPYVSAWAERYRDRGLVVVGVHCPEFGFEHDVDNVRHATRQLGVDYPVVIDNDFAIWQSLANRYWPALYLVDRDGRIRFHHFGEGNYEQTEQAIQQLLGIDEKTVPVDAGGLAEAADWDILKARKPTSATAKAPAAPTRPRNCHSTTWRCPATGPSRRTVKRTGAPEARGVRTRLRSRAWKRKVTKPPAALRTADSSSMAQSPDSAHWLSR